MFEADLGNTLEGILGAQTAVAFDGGTDIGQALGAGMDAGIMAAAGRVAAAAAALVQGARNAARSKADAHSPSRAMAKLGTDMGEGLALGIDKGAPAAVDAAAKMAASVLNAYASARMESLASFSEEDWAKAMALAGIASGEIAAAMYAGIAATIFGQFGEQVDAAIAGAVKGGLFTFNVQDIGQTRGGPGAIGGAGTLATVLQAIRDIGGGLPERLGQAVIKGGQLTYESIENTGQGLMDALNGLRGELPASIQGAVDRIIGALGAGAKLTDAQKADLEIVIGYLRGIEGGIGGMTAAAMAALNQGTYAGLLAAAALAEAGADLPADIGDAAGALAAAGAIPQFALGGDTMGWTRPGLALLHPGEQIIPPGGGANRDRFGEPMPMAVTINVTHPLGTPSQIADAVRDGLRQLERTGRTSRITV